MRAKTHREGFDVTEWSIGVVESPDLTNIFENVVHENMQELLDNLEITISQYAPNGNDICDGDLSIAIVETSSSEFPLTCSLKEAINAYANDVIEERDGSSSVVRNMRAAAEHILAVAKRLEVEAPDHEDRT